MHYQLMSLEDIKNMPVADLAEENAHLWLWIPNGLLQEGLDVMKAWGFKYRDPFPPAYGNDPEVAQRASLAEL